MVNTILLPKHLLVTVHLHQVSSIVWIVDSAHSFLLAMEQPTLLVQFPLCIPDQIDTPRLKGGERERERD